MSILMLIRDWYRMAFVEMRYLTLFTTLFRRPLLDPV